MTTDLAQALGTQETVALEFKQSADLATIRKTICAFANDLPGLGGGEILIGVDKAGNSLGGVDTSDEELLKLNNLKDDGKILDRPSLVVTVEQYQGKPVVRLRVNASGAPPVRLDGVVWVRSGPSTRRAAGTTSGS